ncbi:uncharacterized protein LOC144607421 [Rhinoraja longicauda]
MIVEQLHDNLIIAKINIGAFKDDIVMIPRIMFTLTEDEDIPLKRRQFPIQSSFAMTIHKALGQTMENVLIYLEKPFRPERGEKSGSWAENQKAEDVSDSGGGGGGRSNTTPPLPRPAPDKGVEVKRRRQRQQQQPELLPVQRAKKAPVGPTVTERVLSVAASNKQRRGISLAALKKALSAMGYDMSRNNNRVNRTVWQLVQRGSLVRTSGTGAFGSFRFNRTAAPKREKKAGPVHRKASSKTEKKARSCKPTAAPSKRSSPKGKGPKRQTKPRRTVARTFKRRPRAGVRPRTKARARLQPRTAGEYRRHGPGRGRKVARGRIQRPVGRPGAATKQSRKQQICSRGGRPVTVLFDLPKNNL